MPEHLNHRAEKLREPLRPSLQFCLLGKFHMLSSGCVQIPRSTQISPPQTHRHIQSRPSWRPALPGQLLWVRSSSLIIWVGGCEMVGARVSSKPLFITASDSQVTLTHSQADSFLLETIALETEVPGNSLRNASEPTLPVKTEDVDPMVCTLSPTRREHPVHTDFIQTHRHKQSRPNWTGRQGIGGGDSEGCLLPEFLWSSIQIMESNLLFSVY